MLAIRMQRTGRKGHAMFRMVVQDSRRTPSSGKVVAQLGSYDPHAKAMTLDKEKASFYLDHGAQPSERVARLLKGEGVTLPAWVNLSADKERAVRNADKRRSTRPPEPEPETPAEEEAPAATDTPETNKETPAEVSSDTPEAETPDTADESANPAGESETPAEEKTEAAPEADAPTEETPETETPEAEADTADAAS